MKIKKGDTVKILSGKDKDKTGKVLKVLISSNTKNKDKVIVEGLNLRYKHIRPKKDGEKGQRIMFPFPVNSSNAILICPKCGEATKVGYKLLKTASETSKEKKQRICKKCSSSV